jgi:ribonuclease P protein component
MFPRSLRLSRAGFENSRRLPRTATPHFSLSYGRLPNAAGIGIIVPKKVAKSSVERHLLKRRIREIIREASKLQKLSGATLIVTARKGASTLHINELKDELSGAIKAILLENSFRIP